MNKDVWKEIRIEYETTCTSYIKLSKKYGFSKNAVADRSKKERWTKFKKMREKLQKKAEDTFLKQSETKLLDLIRKEDETLAKFQEVVDGKVPYERIFRSIEGLNGDLKIKIDGTVKGLVETTMLIGDKRRELRGSLPLKDQELINIKREELEHKKELDNKKLKLEEDRLDIEIEKVELAKEKAKKDKNERLGVIKMVDK